MTTWEALVLGAIQGLTEFLPVSSSGHLVMGQAVLEISVQGVLFEVAVHVATLASVLVVYRRRLARVATGMLRREASAWRYVALLGLATLPAAFVGLLWGSRVEALFESPVVVGVALLVTGTLLWSTRRIPTRRSGEETSVEEEADRFPGAAAALAMGVAQAFALVPGISRSGATVVAGLWAGVGVVEAAAFSFLMAIPAIAGAAVLKIPELQTSGTGIGAGPLAWGAVVAAATGVAAIRVFVAMLRRGSFHRFGLYCWVAGAAFLLYLGVR